MGNGSPTAYLLWAILSCIYLVFLLLHLWNYDRFQCLRWDSGRQPGAFKRVMTYSYLATVPLLVVFSVAITVLKFKEGFLIIPGGAVVPRPFSLWDPVNRVWVLPLYFVLSIAWALEHVTHLEELTFWVFLLNQGPGKREWFASWEFRVWTIGSVATLTSMPMTVLTARHNIDTCLAYIFLVGSAAGTTTTVCFLYVLGRFPWFIRHVKSEGAEPDVVIRLATFYQLNRIRVVFRYLFTLPLMIIALDGLAAPYTIIGDPFAMDFLLMMGGIGCFISSAITLLIFFPRSITRESGYQTKPQSPHHTNTTKMHLVHPQVQYHTSSSTTRQEQEQEHEHANASLSKSTIVRGHGHAAEVRMGAFRLPDAGSGEGEGEGEGEEVDFVGSGGRDVDAYSYSFDLVRSGSSTSGHPQLRLHSRVGREEERRRRRRRVESSVSELSPGYMSDAESVSEVHGVEQGRGQGHGKTVSSDDTVWDRKGGPGHGFRYRQEDEDECGGGAGGYEGRRARATEPSVGNGERVGGWEWERERAKRRRYSDGPFFFDTRGQLLSPRKEVGAGPRPVIRTEMGSGRGAEVECAGPVPMEESALHPYVIHFTSPIDLHDGGRLSQSERGRVRRQAV